jgi:hypothetical protein
VSFDGTEVYEMPRRNPTAERKALLENALYCFQCAEVERKAMLRSIRDAGGLYGILASKIQGAVGHDIDDALEDIKGQLRQAEKEGK